MQQDQLEELKIINKENRKNLRKIIKERSRPGSVKINLKDSMGKRRAHSCKI